MRPFILPILGLLVLSANFALGWTAPWLGMPTTFLTLISCLAVISGLTAYLAPRFPSNRQTMFWILLIALLVHIIWFLTPPILSDDVYRYSFEGRLVRNGVSPYAHPPISETVAVFRDDEVWPRIGHPELSTVYPPISLLMFGLGDWLGGVRGEKFLFGSASLLCVVVIVLLLARSQQPLGRAAAYAWAPLPALEFAGSGHHDSLGILLLLVGISLLSASHRWGSVAAWITSVGIKGFTLLALPAFWREWNWIQRGTALLGAVVVLSPLFFLSQSDHSGLTAYSQRWEHNDIAFYYISGLLGDPQAARWVCAGILGVVGVALVWTRVTFLRSMILLLIAALFLSPTLHPWYAGWSLALAPLVPSVFAWTLGQTVLVTYALPGIQAEPGFSVVPMIWRVFEWGLPLVVASWIFWRGRRTGAEDGDPELSRMTRGGVRDTA